MKFKEDKSNWQIALLNAVVATIGSLLTLTIYPIIAFLIKRDSKGPVLFRQTRIGKHGKPFHMYKFRTMVVDAEELKDALQNSSTSCGPAFKMVDDPRITKVGKVLRRYSLDELPQFFSVLIGDMSVVGPRPPIVSEVDQYKEHEMLRLSVKPGLTCYWQINKTDTWDQWVDLDLQYINNKSLLTDIELIIKTPMKAINNH